VLEIYFMEKTFGDFSIGLLVWQLINILFVFIILYLIYKLFVYLKKRS